ncbi:MAG: hypothetical protein QGI25_03715 [Arenicellales bacterium]|nr:hypothetical protein [Arenicellales bacterium]
MRFSKQIIVPSVFALVLCWSSTMAGELPFRYGVWSEFPTNRPPIVIWVTLSEGFFGSENPFLWVLDNGFTLNRASNQASWHVPTGYEPKRR